MLLKRTMMSATWMFCGWTRYDQKTSFKINKVSNQNDNCLHWVKLTLKFHPQLFAVSPFISRLLFVWRLFLPLNKCEMRTEVKPKGLNSLRSTDQNVSLSDGHQTRKPDPETTFPVSLSAPAESRGSDRLFQADPGFSRLIQAGFGTCSVPQPSAAALLLRRFSSSVVHGWWTVSPAALEHLSGYWDV